VSHSPQNPTTNQPPTEHCGATTIGMYGRLLGPCLHAPDHPEKLLHRDVHGSEWLEYDHTDATPALAHNAEGAK
jgi:hypothetical protein